MKSRLKQIIRRLDGQPAETKGQSLVELTLTLPIFLIMLVGLMEVGWYANNWLIIDDTVRSAGRFASLRDPNDWVEGNEQRYHWMDCDTQDATFNKFPGDNITSESRPWSIPGFTDGLEGASGDLGFYDGAACTALANLAPLEFDDFRDDIIISVFSYARLNDCNQDGTVGDICIKITGRYPIGQNECAGDPGDYRDPFDWDETANNPLEISEGIDAGSENIRGYVFRGNFESAPGCLGSQYSLEWMEERLRASLVDTDVPTANTLEASFIPNYGAVLVEFSFHSDQLLGMPFFTVFADPIRIHSWAIFPVSAAEPEF